jgi:hypothetical protein
MVATPPKKKSNTLLYVGGGCLAVIALGCCGYLVSSFVIGGALFGASSAVENAEEQAQEAQNTSTSTGGSVCSRAADCCNAYYDAMGPAMESGRSACANYASLAGGPAESSCQSSIDTFRQSLTAINHEVPASCQ